MDTNKTVLILSIPLAALVLFASVVGLFTPGFYSNEFLSWQAQSVGQDAVDLFLVSPVLISTAIFTGRNKIVFPIWAGVNLYLIYTYVIYCFDIHFNSLFIIYCLILGLSFYSFLYFLLSKINEPVKREIYNRTVIKIIAFYFFIVSCLFYFLWLSEIVPAIVQHKIPKAIADTGLITNPVHVIDLSIILPAFFLTSILLIRKKSAGLYLVPVMLAFTILMDITIGWLTIVMNMKGIESGYSVTVMMACLAVLSIVLLIWYIRSIEFLQNLTASKRLPVINKD